MRSIVLLGMMGAGKSTVGELVAARLGREFVDTDAEVERVAGRTIAAVFASDGEAAFRALERDVVTRSSERDDLVVALGGGAVLDAANVTALRATGLLVWLLADPATLGVRIGDGANRPLLGADPARSLDELARTRFDAYARAAHHRVAADGPVTDVVREVLDVAAGHPDVLSEDERVLVTR